MKRFIKSALLIAILLLVAFPAYGKEYWLVLDSSGSIDRDQADLRNRAAKSFVRLLMNTAAEDYMVGLIDFGHEVKPFQPANDLNTLLNSISSIGHSGSHTDMEAALNYFVAHPPEMDREIFLFTDGVVDVPGPRTKDQESEKRILTSVISDLLTQNYVTRVHTVGLRNRSDMEFLHHLSAPTGGVSQAIDSIDEFFEILLRLKVASSNSLQISDMGGAFQVDPQVTTQVMIIAPPDIRIDPPVGKEVSIKKQMLVFWFSVNWTNPIFI